MGSISNSRQVLKEQGRRKENKPRKGDEVTLLYFGWIWDTFLKHPSVLSSAVLKGRKSVLADGINRLQIIWTTIVHPAIPSFLAAFV